MRIALLFALLLPLVCSAQIYKTVDADGNVVFTDAPPSESKSSEAVDLQETNITQPPPDLPRSAPKPPPQSATPAAPTVSITSPANETTIPMGPGNFSVTATTEGQLGFGQKMQLLLDGSPSGEPQAGSSWSLTNIPRGEHSLMVSIVDDDGETISSSAPVTVYVLRPSILFK